MAAAAISGRRGHGCCAGASKCPCPAGEKAGLRVSWSRFAQAVRGFQPVPVQRLDGRSFPTCRPWSDHCRTFHRRSLRQCQRWSSARSGGLQPSRFRSHSPHRAITRMARRPISFGIRRQLRNKPLKGLRRQCFSDSISGRRRSPSAAHLPFLYAIVWNDRLSIRLGRLTINSVSSEEFLGSQYFKAFASVGVDLVPRGLFFNAPGAFGYPDTTWGARVKFEPVNQFYAIAALITGTQR